MTNLPKRIKRLRKVNLTAFVPADLRTKIVRLAKRQGRSISFIMEGLLADALGQIKKEDDSGI